MDDRVSPERTTWTKKVGIGVGVGRMNDGGGVGPVGLGDTSSVGVVAVEADAVSTGSGLRTRAGVGTQPTTIRSRHRRLAVWRARRVMADIVTHADRPS